MCVYVINLERWEIKMFKWWYFFNIWYHITIFIYFYPNSWQRKEQHRLLEKLLEGIGLHQQSPDLLVKKWLENNHKIAKKFCSVPTPCLTIHWIINSLTDLLSRFFLLGFAKFLDVFRGSCHKKEVVYILDGKQSSNPEERSR